jgi:hypothetical protein
MLDVVSAVVAIALVVAVGLWVAIGIQDMRQTNIEKLDVLQGYVQRPVVIVKAWGRSTFGIRAPMRHPGAPNLDVGRG